MPGYDRTGPLGRGPLSGRQLGLCRQRGGTGRRAGGGFGRGMGRGLRRGFGNGGVDLEDEIARLERRIADLEAAEPAVESEDS